MYGAAFYSGRTTQCSQMMPDKQLSMMVMKAMAQFTKTEGPTSHRVPASTSQALLPQIL